MGGEDAPRAQGLGVSVPRGERISREGREACAVHLSAHLSCPALDLPSAGAPCSVSAASLTLSSRGAAGEATAFGAGLSEGGAGEDPCART